jgi:hypothetical protein
MQARRHLGELFDVPDYDIACVLFPLSWWSRLYANTYAEGPFSCGLPCSQHTQTTSCVLCHVRVREAGLGKQSYYLTLGQNICESVGATNDETYWNFA